jgi:hypothetical protein
MLTDDLALTGGLLPDQAVRAIAVDRGGREHEAVRGEHAWLALVPEPPRGQPPMVRFLDAAGELVAAPLPDDAALESVPDADEPCPVCRAADWALIAASRRAADGGGRDGRETAVCRRCGHREGLPVLLGPPAAVASAPDARAEFDSRMARPPAADLRSLSFDVYGLPGLTPTVVGVGGKREKADRVTLAFVTADGRVTVRTDSRQPRGSTAQLARQALDELLRERDSARPDWPHRSKTAYGLWLNGRARARATAAAVASVGEIALGVDGTPTQCLIATDGERFAAVTRLRVVTVTIAGHGSPAGLELETVTVGA